MSSGKKGKKTKGKTVPLQNFLADMGGPATLVKTSTLWADDVEDEYEPYMSSKSKEPINLPTAPRAARDFSLDEDNIPTKPPYNVYLSNLPYEADEEDIMEFFADMKVTNIHLPASKDGNKSKGIGYVEFEDRQSIIDALIKPNMFLKTRRIRIEVSNSSSDDRRGRMGRMGDNRRDDRYSDPERTTGDWRSGPREEARSEEGDRYRPRGGFDREGGRDRKDDREGGAEIDNKPGAWRDSGDRGRSSFRDRDDGRDGREWNRYGNDRGSRDRDGDRDRDRGSSFGPRRNFGGDSNRDWDRQSNRPPPAGDSEPSSELRTRPKLNLAPRTIPVEAVIVEKAAEETKETETVKAEETPATAPLPALPAVNIFGEAKPVDTAAKEREIEARLTKSQAEFKSKEESDSERGDKRGVRNGTWGRRNEESRDERDRERRKPETWRNDGDKERNYERPSQRSQAFSSRNDDDADRDRGDSRAPPLRAASPRRGPPAPRGSRPTESRAPPPERERKADKDDEMVRMPKAKDEEAPNFAASNKYSMLPDDVEPDVDE